MSTGSQTPEPLEKGVLYCLRHDIYRLPPLERELQNEDVWRQYGFQCPPSRQTLDRFISEFRPVTDDVFIELLHELAEQVPLDKLFRIDGTDIPFEQRDDDARWSYNHTEEDYCNGSVW